MILVQIECYRKTNIFFLNTNIKWHSIYTPKIPLVWNYDMNRCVAYNKTKCRLISNDEYIGMNESAGQTQLKSFTIASRIPVTRKGKPYCYCNCDMYSSAHTQTHGTYETGQLL